jgi:hypothetical protein
MHIFILILCYANAVLITVCAISFQIHNGIDVSAFNMGKAIDVVIFGILSLWVFTIGFVIAFVQLVYGIIKTGFAKEKKIFHKHTLAAALISTVAYIVIFTTDFYYIDKDGNRISKDTEIQNTEAAENNKTSETGLDAYRE